MLVRYKTVLVHVLVCNRKFFHICQRRHFMRSHFVIRMTARQVKVETVHAVISRLACGKSKVTAFSL